MKDIRYIHKSKYMSHLAYKKGVIRLKLFIMMLLIPLMIQAQSDAAKPVMIEGKVIDAATLKPIAAAQISISDKNVSAITDEQGKFSIKMTSRNDIMQVTAIGYDLREIAVQGRNSLTVVLYRTGFSVFSRKIQDLTKLKNQLEITSSTDAFDKPDKYAGNIADDIIRSAMGGNVRAVSRSGLSGMGANIFIRGVNSLNTNAQPLFVVDGVIWNQFDDVASIHGGYFSNPFDNIDVNDIASVTVLKDGTSIYGSKAANGVILIQTQRTNSMVTAIDFNVLTGFNNAPASLPMMGAEQHRVYASDMLGSMGYTPADLSNVGFLITDPANPAYNVYHNNTDWNKEVYRTGVIQNYLINVKGGDDKAKYYFSLGLTNNQGVVKSTDWTRYNVRLNGDFLLTNKIDLALNIGITRNERSLIDDGINYFSSPTWMSKIKSPFVSPFEFTVFGEKTTNPARTDIFNVGNPGALIRFSNNFQKKYRFNIGATPGYQITPDIKLQSQFDYSLYKTIEGHYVPELFTPIREIPNKGFSKNRISSQVIRNTNIYSNTFLTYSKKWNVYHQLRAVAGLRFIHNYLELDYAEEHNSGSNNNTTITGGYDFLYVDGLNNRTRSLSNYYQAEYAYDNRYFLTGTLALDASSRFGRHTDQGINLTSYKKDRETGEILKDRSRSLGVFPAINGAWIATSEEFMKNVGMINFLKVRAGYGVTGNDGIKDYESMAYFTSVRFVDRANGLVLSNLENTKVQWENTGRANLGFDVGMFNDLLMLNIDLFSSRTTNLLTLKALPEISGLGYYWSNGGSMTNKGYELSAAVKALNTNSVQWEIGVTAGSYKNRVTSLPDDKNYTVSMFGAELLTAVGQPAGVFYGYKANGVFANQADADAANLKFLNHDGSYTSFAAGDMIFEDKVADGVIDAGDRQIIGSPHPDLYGNIRSTLKYRAFTLNTTFTYSLGNEVYNYYRRELESGKNFSNQTMAMMRRWTGENQQTDVPRAVYGDPMGNARFSNRWIEDASYLKWQNVSVSYDLPIKNDYIEGMKVWVSAENLYTWTGYLGLDPEVSAGSSPYMQGIDAGLLPRTRGYYVGLKVNL